MIGATKPRKYIKYVFNVLMLMLICLFVDYLEVVMAQLARFVIFRGRDPFTVPQTMVDWVSTSIPGVKQPVIRKKWMNSEIDLIVNGPDRGDVMDAAQGCLQQAAIRSILAGIITGYASGGTAGIEVAVATFTQTIDSCMESKINEQLDITSSLENSSSWDADWS